VERDQKQLDNAAFRLGDAIQSYVKRVEIFQCPSEKKTAMQSDPTQSGYTDYWFNKRLSGLTFKVVPEPPLTIISGDGNSGIGGTNARYSKDHLPAAWVQQEGSPARRHLDGANYWFADGHVKFCRPENVTLAPPKDGKATFAIK
jgi:prepilin-type processing-associated H-X9-DG protein